GRQDFIQGASVRFEPEKRFPEDEARFRRFGCLSGAVEKRNSLPIQAKLQVSGTQEKRRRVLFWPRAERSFGLERGKLEFLALVVAEGQQLLRFRVIQIGHQRARELNLGLRRPAALEIREPQIHAQGRISRVERERLVVGLDGLVKLAKLRVSHPEIGKILDAGRGLLEAGLVLEASRLVTVLGERSIRRLARVLSRLLRAGLGRYRREHDH